MLQNFGELKAVIDFLPSAKETFHSWLPGQSLQGLCSQVVLAAGLGPMFSVAFVAPCKKKPPCLDGKDLWSICVLDSSPRL